MNVLGHLPFKVWLVNSKRLQVFGPDGGMIAMDCVTGK
jgi:hypothetical protein